MKVHLFGLPVSTHRRLKDESGGWADAVPEPHSFRASPISTNSQSQFTEGELRDLATSVSDGFTHIVIPGSRDWKIVQSRFLYDCRVHMARLWEPLKNITWALLRESLHAATRLDEIWLQKLSPLDARHPLLLPPNVFATVRNTHRFWHRCDVYSEGQIAEAEGLLTIVDKEHRKADGAGGRSWIDGKKWRYRIDPSKHGRSVVDRAGGKQFRFCYEIPAGFHYDVVDDSGKSFGITLDGKPQKLTHCNITPWGQVRRG